MITHKKIPTVLIACLLLVSTVTILARFDPASGQSLQATLTGNISDRGVDTNGNGKYDFLEVTVEINVTEPGEFRIQVNSLMDEFGNTFGFYQSQSGYLDTGIQYVNLSFSGSAVYGSTFNPRNVSEIDLFADQTGWPPMSVVYDIALSRVYYWNEFDTHAYFTGTVSDRGVDTDRNGLYNYLEVGIEFNVTESGRYQITIESLKDVSGIYTRYFYDYTQNWVMDDFSAGIHTVYLNFSGPKIAYENFNPTNIGYAYLYDATGKMRPSCSKKREPVSQSV